MIKAFRKKQRNFSLGLILLAVPIFVLSLGTLYVQSRYLIHKKVSESALSKLKTTQHEIRNYMSTIETAVDANVWMMEENFSPNQLQNVANRIVRLNPNVISSSVFAVPGVLDNQGQLFSLYTINRGDTIITYREVEYDYLDKVFYTNPISTGNSGWIDPYKDNAEWGVDPNKAVATYCSPIKQKDGRILGVVNADFLFSRLAKMINQTEHPYASAYYILLGADGRYLIHPDSTRLFRKTIFTDVDPDAEMDIITLGHEMTARKQGTMHVDANGVKYHVCYMPVDGTEWSLALVNPDYEAMKSFYKMGYVIVVLLIIGLLVIMLLCRHVVKQLVSPINNLIDAADKIAHGQYDEDIPTTNEKGLISNLQNRFAMMQQALKDRMGNMQKNVDEIRKNNGRLNKEKMMVENSITKKNSFIQQVTKQLRMPLNVITGFADVLSGTDKMQDEELSSISDMMKNNVISMNRMVMMLYDVTESDIAGELKLTRSDEVLCNKISQECISHTLNHFPHANISFETSVHDTLCLLTNRAYLMSILCELLYNSAKYTDGTNVKLSVTETDTTVSFAIQDIGSGLPADLPDEVFNPFKMKDDQPEAAGLGLPLVKRHAIALGGSLTIDTSYFVGCRIVLELPK